MHIDTRMFEPVLIWWWGSLFIFFCCFSWEQAEELRLREENQRAQEEQYRYHLAVLTEEEAEYQQRQYANDINRIVLGVTSASPRFIAQNRLTNRSLVSGNLIDTACSICLENFHLNEYCSRWPCSAQHTFQFHCISEVLRAGNSCPLCQHPVEAAVLPNREILVRFLFSRMIPTAFTWHLAHLCQEQPCFSYRSASNEHPIANRSHNHDETNFYRPLIFRDDHPIENQG